MTMDAHDTFQWATDTHVAPSGEQMERVMTLSARQNAYSRGGLALWRQHTQHRKRPRAESEHDEDGALTSDQANAGAEAVKAAIHQLLQMSGLEYAISSQETGPSAPCDTDRPADNHTTPVVAPAATSVAPPDPSASSTAAVQSMPPPSQHAPVSSLAKLVARAKAQHPTSSTSPVGGGHERDRAASPTATTPTVTSSPRTDDSRTQTTPAVVARPAHNSDDEDEDFGVVLPGSVAPRPADGDEAGTASVKHPSQMTREEYLSQFKRAPRRGEMGQDANTILAAEKLGYVMSGSRSKASQMYVDRIQRQLHEREAAKLQQQFRKVEDARQDDHLIDGLLNMLEAKRQGRTQ